jgi:hypothetical protein
MLQGMMILSIFVVRIMPRTKIDRMMRNVLLILLFSFLSLSTVNADEETYYSAVTNPKGWNPAGTRAGAGIHTVPYISVSHDFIRIYSSEILPDVSITILDARGTPLYHTETTLCAADNYVPITNLSPGSYVIIICQRSRRLYGYFDKE